MYAMASISRRTSGEPSALTCTKVNVKIALKEFFPRTPDLPVLLDVDDEDGHLHHILHRSAGCLDKMLDFGEDDLRLFVFTLAFDGYPVFRSET